MLKDSSKRNYAPCITQLRASQSVLAQVGCEPHSQLPEPSSSTHSSSHKNSHLTHLQYDSPSGGLKQPGGAPGSSLHDPP
mmetsp:Transcript_53724/g.85516  ORF Transcript_53724/g.85516 Transcript_53724/m.85516 type:complete len:80 (+) Transcript_53724:145-384(+)